MMKCPSVDGGSSSGLMENWNESTIGSRRSLPFRMENPFSFKLGQVFTGFGIGCGVGIGVGRPIYLGSIPPLQQVMSATRGATDAFSGVGVLVNSTIRKLGIKNIEAGVGCGVGVGHGFGVGIALKPGVVNRIQSSLAQLVTRLMMSTGLAPRSVQSSDNVFRGISGVNMHSPIGNFLETASNTAGINAQLSRSNGSSHIGPSIPNQSEGMPLDKSSGSRTEKVLDNFLQNPIFKHEEDGQLHALADKLRLENDVHQVVLKHQQIIQELLEENQRLRRVLIEDLKVSPSKLEASRGRTVEYGYPCSNCFDCRRRNRKSGK